MRCRIRKWGNSFALRIPKAAADELNLTLGVEVEIVVRRGRLIVRVAPGRRYRLGDLLRGVRKSNVHDEVDWGRPVGRESW